MSRETKVAAIPDVRDDNVTEVLRAIKNVLQVREGHLGDALDQNVTLRDLTDLKIVTSGGTTTLTSGAKVPVIITGTLPDGYDPTTDYTTPPAPTGLTVTSGMTSIYLQWNGAPIRNNSYTEIWRASVDVLGTAVRIATTATNTYADAVGKTSQVYYYWIRFVTEANVIGPYNSTAGTMGGTGLVGGVDLSPLIITADKIASGAIDLGGDKILGLLKNANMEVITDPTKIADSLIGNTKLANLAITAGKIANGAIDLGGTKVTGLLANANMAVITDPTKIADYLISSTKLADLSVLASKIASGAVTLTKFASGIEPVTIASGALPTVKSTETLVYNGKLYRWSGSAYTAAVATSDLSGTILDAQIAGLAASKITGQLSDSQIADIAAAKLTGQITSTQITDGSISTPKLAAGSVSTAKLAAGAVTADTIAANAITTAKIDAGAITTAKIAAGTILASNIAAGTITGDNIAASTITGSNILADSITAAQIAAGAISASELAVGAVTAGKIAANAIIAGDGVIANAAITNALIANAAVGSAQIANAAITAAKIGDLAVGTAAIQTGAITTALIANAAIGSAQIADAAITSAKIGSLAVGNAAIQNGAITNAKIGDMAADKITTGNLTAAVGITTGYIAGGVTPGMYPPGHAFFGTGFFLGLDSSVFKFYVGSYSKNILWDGSNLSVKGTISASSATFQGLTITDNSGNVLLSSGGIPYTVVNGLGSLATQNTVAAGSVTGLGGLATQDSVFFGSTVKFPDGSTANTGDFVNRLSQITSANVSTFIASAAIGEAYIGNAAISSAKIQDAAIGTAKIADAAITTAKISDASITNAKIGTAEISTLKLNGEAVTVPRFAEQVSSGVNLTTSWSSDVCSVSYTVSGLGSGEQARVVVVAVMQAYPTNNTITDLVLGIFADGTLNTSVASTFGENGLSMANVGSWFVGNGTYTASLKVACFATGTGSSSKSNNSLVSRLIVLTAKR